MSGSGRNDSRADEASAAILAVRVAIRFRGIRADCLNVTRLLLVSVLAFILGLRVGVVHGWRCPWLAELPPSLLAIGVLVLGIGAFFIRYRK